MALVGERARGGKGGILVGRSNDSGRIAHEPDFSAKYFSALLSWSFFLLVDRPSILFHVRARNPVMEYRHGCIRPT